MRSGLGIVGCVLITAVGIGALAIGISGLTTPEPAGGLARTLGGIAGYFAVCAAVVGMLLRS